jgi:hypothetical protein
MSSFSAGGQFVTFGVQIATSRPRALSLAFPRRNQMLQAAPATKRGGATQDTAMVALLAQLIPPLAGNLEVSKLVIDPLSHSNLSGAKPGLPPGSTVSLLGIKARRRFFCN